MTLLARVYCSAARYRGDLAATVGIELCCGLPSAALGALLAAWR